MGNDSAKWGEMPAGMMQEILTQTVGGDNCERLKRATMALDGRNGRGGSRLEMLARNDVVR